VTLTGVGLALAGASAFFPLFPSRTLSPDVIMRRLFWTGTVIAVVASFLAIWPDWKVGLFASLSVGLFLLITALRYTSHLSISRQDLRPPRQPRTRPSAVTCTQGLNVVRGGGSADGTGGVRDVDRGGTGTRVTALRYPSHLRFRGRIYGHPDNRGPDAHPVRAPKGIT
jgi:hypothetical protein